MGLAEIKDKGIGYAPIPAEYALALEEETISEIVIGQNDNTDQCHESAEKVQEHYNEMRMLGI